MYLPNDFKSEYKFIKSEIDSAIKKVLDSGWFILGKEVETFEREFAKYLGVKYCVGVGNGLEAIFLILKALGIGTGDEVIVPSNTYIATVLSISHTGAQPVFVEPDIQTYNIEPTKIEKKITQKTKAIIPVHLYGLCANMNQINRIAKKYELHIIEDAAQAHGSMFRNKKAGSLGDAGAFSFYPTKNLGAYGDGGCVVTNSKWIFEQVSLLRNYGSPRKYHNNIIGFNSRLDEIQAAIIRIKLRHLDKWNKLRRQAVKDFKNIFKNMDWIWPIEPDGFYHTYHQLVVRSKKREEDIKYLENLGYKCLIHYPIPPYKSEAYKDSYLGQKFPIADEISETIFSLPIHGFIWSNKE